MTNVEKKQQQNSAKTPKNSPTHTRAVYKQLVNMCACVCVYVYLCRLGHLKVKRINSAAPERGFQSKVQQPAARGDKERWEGGKKPAKIVAFSGEFANCTSCSGHAAFKERASERERGTSASCPCICVNACENAYLSFMGNIQHFVYVN